MPTILPFGGKAGFRFPVASEASDPMASLSFALRLQTHNGDNVPLGLYQDVAGTIPATEDGHPIACWRDEISDSGLEATQPTEAYQPILYFDNGVPVILGDGIDDDLLMSGVISPVWCMTSARRDGGALMRAMCNGPSGECSFVYFDTKWQANFDGQSPHILGDSVGYDRMFMQGSAGATRTGFNGTVVSRADGVMTSDDYVIGNDSDGNNQSLNGGMTFIAFGLDVISEAMQEIVDQYVLSLNPE